MTPQPARRRTPFSVLSLIVIAMLLVGSGIIVESNKWLFIVGTWCTLLAIYIKVRKDARRG